MFQVTKVELDYSSDHHDIMLTMKLKDNDFEVVFTYIEVDIQYHSELQHHELLSFLDGKSICSIELNPIENICNCFYQSLKIVENRLRNKILRGLTDTHLSNDLNDRKSIEKMIKHTEKIIEKKKKDVENRLKKYGL